MKMTNSFSLEGEKVNLYVLLSIAWNWENWPWLVGVTLKSPTSKPLTSSSNITVNSKDESLVTELFKISSFPDLALIDVTLGKVPSWIQLNWAARSFTLSKRSEKDPWGINIVFCPSELGEKVILYNLSLSFKKFEKVPWATSPPKICMSLLSNPLISSLAVNIKIILLLLLIDPSEIIPVLSEIWIVGKVVLS